ncbi:HD domain-containing phosphohydrolase [Magnetospirillum molischianum]|uniref:Putative two-component response transcriptional regulator (CheY family) n=1 Tax=Magnetospirillum molischianum DSM 120 TaxID=1150626 RepID=H8FNU6_MAGML|nr:HD domain-containing phosphohydrolase [Magnetospirillum molischianum]CCG40034.1 Putative two-component response transcriptional regulator (CheY family) [Magnetospirillum molischianum DSM 120]
MTERVLLIDDDSHLLSALRRQFDDEFDLVTATEGAAAIEAVRTGAPFAVAISDMRMPGMDGVETLKAIRALAPDTVRMMLTGNADQTTAIDAINHGAILRFYTKPCPTDQLREGILAGIEQYRLITAERDLLEKTLTGSLKVLVDVVSMNDPVGHQLAVRLREWVRLLAVEMRMSTRWQLEIAATLIGIGQVAIPTEITARLRAGEDLSEIERQIVERAPEAARNLVSNIPRLEKVAEILYYQDKGFDGSGFPPNGPSGDEIPFDARLLRVLKDLAVASAGGPLSRAAFTALEAHRERYDPRLLAGVRMALEKTLSTEAPTVIEVPLASLRVGQTILSDIRQTNGHLILAANSQISNLQLERLRNLRRIVTFIEPIKVRA